MAALLIAISPAAERGVGGEEVGVSAPVDQLKKLKKFPADVGRVSMQKCLHLGVGFYIHRHYEAQD